MLIENMTMAFAAIRANKMRSFLTMLGIIIGIGSVIAIVSIGDTMRNVIADIYKDVGATQAYLQPGYWLEETRQSDFFTLDEMERIKEVFGDELDYIDCSVNADADAQYQRTKVKFSYEGIDYNYRDVQPVNMVYGRYLNEGDIKDRRKSVVMDAKSSVKLFGTENGVGKTFRTTLAGSTDEYTVVGVYTKTVNPLQALLMGNDGGKGSAYIPYTLLAKPNENFYALHMYAGKDVNLDDFYSRVTAYVAKQKGRNPEDFYLYTAASEMGSIDSMMAGLAAAVGGIAAISLLVGGIGIMNIMLVSVTERTREIGIRKSLGARTKDILIQFLTESAILSACGGIIGILLGVGLVSMGAAIFGIKAVIKPEVVLLAVGFSAMVGIFFGIYPASKAAKADPIDALRYE